MSPKRQPADGESLFVHLAIDGRVHPKLGIQFRWPEVPSAGQSLTLRDAPMVVDALRQEENGRWVLYLRNYDS